MICDQAIELLPWLLNGTLEGVERDEVRGHLETCDRCRRALAETRETWSLFAQHLSSQDLVALAWGETPSGIDASTAEDHLASCPQCAAELELARMSRRLEEEDKVAIFPAARRRQETATGSRTWRAAALAAGLAGIVASGGWIYEFQQSNELAAQLAQQGDRVKAPETAQLQTAAGEGSSLREQVARLESQVRQLAGLQQENEKKAAAAQAQVAQLEEEREAFARPQATTMIELREVVRGETSDNTVPRDQQVVLLLPARDGGASGESRAEIVDSAGKTVWKTNRLPVTTGYFSITLPPRSLAPGSYTLRISGRDEHWTFQIVP
jgi:molybdopterin converting factor small subunit